MSQTSSITTSANRQTTREVTPFVKRVGVFIGDRRFFAFKENNQWYAPPIGCPAPRFFVGTDYSVFAKLPARKDADGKHEAESIVLLRMKRDIVRSGGRIKGHKFVTILKGAF